MYRRIYFFIVLFIVSAPFLFSAERYEDSGKGIIKDKNTGLLWQKCTAGKSGGDCSAGEPLSIPYDDAVSYCSRVNLGGKTGWRLPDVNEMKGIIDTVNYNPSINTAFFPGTVPSKYWTSTTYSYSDKYAFYADFNFGTVVTSEKIHRCHVRCVTGP